MNSIKGFLGFLFLLIVFVGCGSTNTVNNNSTVFTRNFQASYFDTWDAVNEVIIKEPFRVVESDKENGIIILKPLQNAGNRNMHFESVKITVLGSDKISAVQIIPEFISYQNQPEMVDFRNNKIKSSFVQDIEKTKADGTFELDLFEKISNILK